MNTPRKAILTLLPLLALATAAPAAPNAQPGASLTAFTLDLFAGPTGMMTFGLPAEVTNGTLYLSGSPIVVVFSDQTTNGQTLGEAQVFDESKPGVPIVDPLPNNLSIPASPTSAVTVYQPLNQNGGLAATYNIQTKSAAVPEPGPLALLFLGLPALACLRRRARLT